MLHLVLNCSIYIYISFVHCVSDFKEISENTVHHSSSGDDAERLG